MLLNLSNAELKALTAPLNNRQLIKQYRQECELDTELTQWMNEGHKYYLGESAFLQHLENRRGKDITMTELLKRGYSFRGTSIFKRKALVIY